MSSYATPGPDWIPSPKLAQHTRAALQHMSLYWPRAFARANETSDDATAWAAGYARRLIGIDYHVIDEAARIWVDGHERPPTPSEFGDLAWNRQRECLVTLPRSESDAQRDDAAADAERLRGLPVYDARDLIDEAGRAAYEIVGSWAGVAQAWSLALDVLPTADSDALIAGTHPDFVEILTTAARNVAAGARPRGGTANNLGVEV